MTAPIKVKGIKYGTWAQYKAATKNQDTLYFITDKGGAIYRGTSMVIPINALETINGTAASSVGGVDISGQSGSKNYHHFKIETFSTDNPQADPTPIEFDVYSKAAVDAVVTVLKGLLDTHRRWGEGTQQDPYVYADGKAGGKNFGHVKLQDTIDLSSQASNPTASDGIAATPVAVYNAIQAALGGIGGAMIFRGNIGDAEPWSQSAAYSQGEFCTYNDGGGQDYMLFVANRDIPANTDWTAAYWDSVKREVSSLPAPRDNYEAGWTYRVCAPGTYLTDVKCEVGDLIIAINDSSGSGSTVIDEDWTVGQANTDGSVTTHDTLDNDDLILGAGGKTVKKLAKGSQGKFLRAGANGVPLWQGHDNTDHGIAMCSCTGTGADLTASLVSGSNFALVAGAVVAVTFTNAVVKTGSKNVTLAVGGMTAKPIYYRGAAIASGVIADGDTATMMYDGTNWNVISVDKLISHVGLSGDYDDLTHKAVLYLNDTNTANTSARQITVGASDFTLTSNRIICVKYTYGISVANPTMQINGLPSGIGNQASLGAQILWHGQNLPADKILAGDMVTYVFDGTSFNVVSIDRKIDPTPTSGSGNFVTSGGVYDAIEAAALTWEELGSASV